MNETFYLPQMGEISRPFSSQLKARTWRDPLREIYQSRIAKVQAVDYPVVGVDVSYWQQFIDWDMLASKVYFAFLRAGLGNSDYDTRYPEYLNGAHRTGRGVGLYWYMKPRVGTNFKQHVYSFASIYKDSSSQLPPVFDVEETGGLNKTELTGWLQKAVMLFEDTVGISPMIYTSPGFWNTNIYRNDWAKNLPLWVAHWTTADNPILPNDWGAINIPKPWAFWQHSSKGIGSEYGASSKYIDLNRYHWSLASFNANYNMDLKPLDSAPPLIEDKIKPLYIAEITVNVLNARAGDGIIYSDIGNLLKGTQLPVVEEVGDWQKVELYMHKGYTKKI